MAALELMKNHVTSRLWDYAAGQERLSVPLSCLFARLLFLGGVQDSTGRTATIQNTFASFYEGMQRVGLTNHKSLKNIAHC